MREKIKEICNKLNKEQLSVHGATKELLNLFSVSKSVRICHSCNGNGWTINTDRVPFDCEECGGTGQIEGEVAVCPKCGNTGRCEPRTLSDPDGQECDCGAN